MRLTSVFCLQCSCGETVEIKSTGLPCPYCGKLLKISWPNDPIITVPAKPQVVMP